MTDKQLEEKIDILSKFGFKYTYFGERIFKFACLLDPSSVHNGTDGGAVNEGLRVVKSIMQKVESWKVLALYDLFIKESDFMKIHAERDKFDLFRSMLVDELNKQKATE